MFKEPPFEGAPEELKEEITAKDIPMPIASGAPLKKEAVEPNLDEARANFRAQVRTLEKYLLDATNEKIATVESKDGLNYMRFNQENVQQLRIEFNFQIQKIKNAFENVIQIEGTYQAYQELEGE